MSEAQNSVAGKKCCSSTRNSITTHFADGATLQDTVCSPGWHSILFFPFKNKSGPFPTCILGGHWHIMERREGVIIVELQQRRLYRMHLFIYCTTIQKSLLTLWIWPLYNPYMMHHRITVDFLSIEYFFPFSTTPISIMLNNNNALCKSLWIIEAVSSLNCPLTDWWSVLQLSLSFIL